ncbi:MAG TPA: PEP-utilizing enzyme [Acidimicrobiia bacterium]|jgi:pyruvate,water dikinase|nr:PEP-utilizing enzyme [Acidimicrobiia bacterium]
MADRFPSPFDIETPAGAEGWEDLYTYSLPFSQDRRDYEDAGFWFQDGIHWPEVLTPWDATFYEYALASLSQYNTRHYLIPPALGVDFRVLNGYAYLAPVGVADPAEIEARVPQFMERAGFYFMNWNDLYEKWLVKIKDLAAEMDAISFDPLPEKEDLEVVTDGWGYGSGLTIQENYRKLLNLGLRLWQYHFEFLNLGYAAYLDFFGFCKEAFPNIPDLSIAKMVAGVDVDLFKPDEYLKELSQAAIDLGVAEAFDNDDPAAVIAALDALSGGDEWKAKWDAVKDPWFNFSSGSGFYHTDQIWVEHKEIPFGFIRNYIGKIREGVDLARPTDAIRAERDRIIGEYRDLLGSDEDREAFDGKLGLAGVVFPYVENHNFYVEHWSHSILWRKMRELGSVFVKEGFFGNVDDVFYLKRDEINEALWDMYGAWAVGVKPRGPAYWPRELGRRKGILNVLRQWSPPPALGQPPEVVTEPFTIMLWGITSDSIGMWLGGADETGALKGFAASPGMAEGPARVIQSADQIGEIQEGEILVAPLTAPSWAPVFNKIGATVTDIGGMMSHAAIVCREYGLPAVTGTAFGTKNITTGQMIRVNGSEGTVEILE